MSYVWCSQSAKRGVKLYLDYSGVRDKSQLIQNDDTSLVEGLTEILQTHMVWQYACYILKYIGSRSLTRSSSLFRALAFSSSSSEVISMTSMLLALSQVSHSHILY